MGSKKPKQEILFPGAIPSAAYWKLSKKDRALYDKNERQRGVDRMKRDPEFKAKVLARAKKAEKQEILRKLKRKGRMTHGSKYGKLKSGLSINGKNR